MKKFIAALIVSLGVLVGCAPALAQATHIIGGASLPLTCTVGDVYAKTGTSSGWYLCKLTDTWTRIADVNDTLAVFATTTPDQLSTVLGGTSGTGNFTRVTSPTFVTPTLGAATATSVNKLIFTAPASGATFTLADGKTFTVNHSITFNGGDNSVISFPNATATALTTNAAVTAAQGGTGSASYTKGDILVATGSTTLVKLAVGSDGQIITADSGQTAGIKWASASGTGDALVANPLSQFASTTSLQLKGVLSDETGSGALVFATSPTFVTPTLGVATATTLNGLTITASAGGTLTITAGKTVSVSNTLTFTGTDSSTVAFGAGGTVIYAANTINALASSSSANLATLLSDETGTGVAVFSTSPSLTTPALGAANATSLVATGLITAGGYRGGFAAKTADYTVLSTDGTLTADATGTSKTITFALPTAASIAGRTYTFLRIDTDTDGAVVLDGNSTETINGNTTYGIAIGDGVTIVSDGTNWLAASSRGIQLADPSADRIAFWDDSAKSLAWLTVGSGLGISGTTITSTAGSPGGSSGDFQKNDGAGGFAAATTISLPSPVTFRAAVCQNTTASLSFDTPVSNPATAACVTGSNTQQAVAVFDDDAIHSVQGHFTLPSDWTGAVDFKGKWYTVDTSGNVVWQIATACVADAETADPSFNSADKVTADAAKGTTLQHNDFSKTGITMTGCAAGEELYFKIFRDAGDAGDDLGTLGGGIANLVSVTFIVRRSVTIGG